MHYMQSIGSLCVLYERMYRPGIHIFRSQLACLPHREEAASLLLRHVERVDRGATAAAVLRILRALRARPQSVETEAGEQVRVAVVGRVTAHVVVDVTLLLIEHDSAT